MTKMLFVKPAANPLVKGDVLVVRDPDNGRVLPPDGKQVPDTAYWRRRLGQRDVTEAEAPTPSKKTDK